MKTISALRRRVKKSALAALALGTVASASLANGGFTYPAGLACSFPLTISDDGPGHRVERTFYDRNGNLVRMINNGTGPDLTLTNASTGASLTLQGNGANMLFKPQENGMVLVRTTGHLVLIIMFPTDSPPGPITVLHVGQLVYTYEPNSSTNFTVVQGSSDRQVNIFQALS
jgi:hypothetical protein